MGSNINQENHLDKDFKSSYQLNNKLLENWREKETIDQRSITVKIKNIIIAVIMATVISTASIHAEDSKEQRLSYDEIQSILINHGFKCDMVSNAHRSQGTTEADCFNDGNMYKFYTYRITKPMWGKGEVELVNATTILRTDRTLIDGPPADPRIAKRADEQANELTKNQKIIVDRGFNCDIIKHSMHQGEGTYSVECFNSTKTKLYAYYIGADNNLFGKRLVEQRSASDYPPKPMWE